MRLFVLLACLSFSCFVRGQITPRNLLQNNAAAAEFLDYQELIGKNFLEITVSEGGKKFKFPKTKNEESKTEHGEWKLLRGNGGFAWGEIFSHFLAFFLSILIDNNEHNFCNV